MELSERHAVVTGGASGIGAALARRFAEEGARVVVADLDGDGAAAVGEEVGGLGLRVDVGREDEIAGLVARAEQANGPVDLFFSNAGIGVDGSIFASDELWDRIWKVNTMAHVYAARAVLPSMLERGAGYLLQTVSAAGLLTHIQSATYAVSKHASLAFAEWLAVAYGDRGINVSALCPQGVRTDMLRRAAAEGRGFLVEGALEPEQVADAVVKGLADERFLILPHPEVGEYFRRKANDYDRWLGGMRKLRRQYERP